MKKIVLPIFVALTSIGVYAQETEKKKDVDFNKWSIELNAGFSKPTQPFVPGAYTETFGNPHYDLGVRYMFNTKFGLKLDAGLDQFTKGDNSINFSDGEYYRFSLQGVANLGRILDFETWTSRIGLLGHIGGGYSFIKHDALSGKDQTINLMVGLTGQVRLSNRVAITADYTIINNLKQYRTWDGITYIEDRGLQNTFLHNASLGLTFYLGSNEKHADWTTYTKESDKLAALEDRISTLENMLVDSDKDGVPDYLDTEPNSVPGVAVDSKGRAIDRNGNGVPDELETYLDKKYGDLTSKATTYDSALVRQFINDGYVATYFDFDKDKPTNVSTEGIDFIRTYLMNNPGASVDILGHADEIGATKYNNGLANRRAQSVKDVLVKSGIDASRLNVISRGEDSSVDANSAQARKLVRRVTFQVK